MLHCWLSFAVQAHFTPSPGPAGVCVYRVLASCCMRVASLLALGRSCFSSECTHDGAQTCARFSTQSGDAEIGLVCIAFACAAIAQLGSAGPSRRAGKCALACACRDLPQCICDNRKRMHGCHQSMLCVDSFENRWQ